MKSFFKKIRCLLLTAAVMLSAACSGMAAVDLNAPVDISENTVVSADVIGQIKSGNSIAVFTGESGGVKYEWTVFGSDISEESECDFGVNISGADSSEVRFAFASREKFGFPAVLSIYLNEKWNTQGATVYRGESAVCSASVTGSKNTVLNFSVTDPVGEYRVSADADISDEAAPAEENAEDKAASDDYLSSADEADGEIIAGVSSDYIPPVDNGAAEADESYLSSAESADGGVYSGAHGAEQKEEHETASADSDDYLSGISDSKNTVQTGENSLDTGSGKKNDERNVNNESDSYLSGSASGGETAFGSGSGSTGGRKYSDGSRTEQDQYLTDPIPAGMPLPVEPGDVEINERVTHTCTFSIECSTILNNLSDLNEAKREVLPSDGVILRTCTVTFYEGESVFDVLQRVCRENGIHMEASWTPIYNSAYVEGIHNLYEFDCGALSGWMYRVNGWYPNYGCSRYLLEQGDVVEWRYTCRDLGKDIGCDWMAGTQ